MPFHCLVAAGPFELLHHLDDTEARVISIRSHVDRPARSINTFKTTPVRPAEKRPAASPSAIGSTGCRAGPRPPVRTVRLGRNVPPPRLPDRHSRPPSPRLACVCRDEASGRCRLRSRPTISFPSSPALSSGGGVDPLDPSFDSAAGVLISACARDVRAATEAIESKCRRVASAAARPHLETEPGSGAGLRSSRRGIAATWP